MYLSLIDAVSKIVKTYGVDILSDPKFWHILSDSYSFGNEYTLKDTFKSCITTGYISKLVAIKGDSKKTKAEIAHIVDSENKINPGKEKEYSIVLYSVAIAIGSCNKKDYSNFTNRYNPRLSKPNKNPKGENNSIWFTTCLIIALGIITLIGGTLLYGWFLLGDAGMLRILCLIGILQFGTFKVLDEFLHNTVNSNVKSRIIICFLPIIVCYIINSIIPLILCSDSIADALQNYFSANFIPQSYYTIPIERAWYAPRISQEVGFFGGFTSIILCICLVSCGYRIISYFKEAKLIVCKIDICASIITLIVIVVSYISVAVWPICRIHRQQKEYDMIVAHNTELHKERVNKVQDLSVKGIKLGISSETAWEYLKALEEDREPSQLHYHEIVKHPDAIYDEFIGTTYYGVFPYKVEVNDFADVNLSGDDYRMLISLDNTTVGLDLYILDGFVSAMRVYGLGDNDNSLTNFDSLLSLYTTKYGDPEIIKDFSFEKDIHAITPYRSKGKSDRYVWNFKNGRIEMSKFGIMYISDTLLAKVRSEYKEGIINFEMAKKRKIEAEKQQRVRTDSIRREQERNDSIRHAFNHKNAINDI